MPCAHSSLPVQPAPVSVRQPVRKNTPAEQSDNRADFRQTLADRLEQDRHQTRRSDRPDKDARLRETGKEAHQKPESADTGSNTDDPCVETAVCLLPGVLPAGQAAEDSADPETAGTTRPDGLPHSLSRIATLKQAAEMAADSSRTDTQLPGEADGDADDGSRPGAEGRGFMAALGQAVSEAARQLAAERQGMDRVPGSGRNGPWQSEAGQHVTAAGLHGHSSRTNQAERPDTVPAADLAGPADQSGQPGLHTVQILPGRATGRHIQSLTDQAASSQEEPAGSVQPMTASPLYAALPASAIAAAEPAVPASDTNPGLANDPAGPLELSGQVIEAIRLRSGPFGETLTVRLKPDRFGEVHIRLARSDTAFSASIVTSQAETYDLLLSELGRLQEALQARGLAVSRIDLVRDTSQSTGTAADQASNDSQAFLAHSQTGQENWSSRDSRGMDRPVTGPGPEQTRSLPARADADRDRPRYGLIDRMA